MQLGHTMWVLLWSGSGSMSSNLFMFIISQQVMNEGVNWEWHIWWFTASLRVTKHSHDFEINGQFLDWQMVVRECIITTTVITLWCDDIGHKDLTYKTTTRNIFILLVPNTSSSLCWWFKSQSFFLSSPSEIVHFFSLQQMIGSKGQELCGDCAWLLKKHTLQNRSAMCVCVRMQHK